jgi:transcriptional antiterminator Rof (Rho-off)
VGLKLNGTYRRLVRLKDVNVLGGSLHTTSIKKNGEALVVTSKEILLEINSDKTYVDGHVSRLKCRTKPQCKDR